MVAMNDLGEFVDASEPPRMALKGADGWRKGVVDRLVESGKLRLCDVCGRPYEPTHGRRCYCSFQCRQEANRYRARMRARRMKAQGRTEGAEGDGTAPE